MGYVWLVCWLLNIMLLVMVRRGGGESVGYVLLVVCWLLNIQATF